ncbi:MAG TPA: CBS domain-containing protein [Verrucomicrobiae bacterium]|nr:CBS domain-containing protein [Verrucomicrobiae bacterium]
MQLRKVMNSDVPAVTLNTPLGEAARRMTALNITSLPVCDGPKLVGLITARDLIVRAADEGLDPRSSTVREVMTRQVICVGEDQDTHRAAVLMQRYNLFQLPVVNQQRHLVGIVYFSDLDRGE